MSIVPGSRLGPYEIVAPLGSGGMGEVYRARDTRLGRDVAVKVLSGAIARDDDALARFEREARAVAALNHPHICVLHDVGREDDIQYLVMELVEGETLAARLARGPIPVEESLGIAVQIASALEAAHRAGVVHRDLKPGNVMLSRSRLGQQGLPQVTLLDFGLAKPQEASQSGAADPHVTRTTPLTARGAILGTLQYMSPEQLEGREADARSDVWAFGCVLYEMLGGVRAFDGSSQASVIAAILKEAPAPVTRHQPLAPAALDRLVRTCLEKAPDDRWQSFGDLRRELQWLANERPDTQTVVPASERARPRARRWPVWAGGVVAAAAAATLLAVWPRSEDAGPARTPVEFDVSVFESGDDRPPHAAVSPDGKTLAYAVPITGVGRALATRRLDHAEPVVLEGTERATAPAWSPDGTELAYFARGKLWSIPATGGRPRLLCDAGYGLGAAWTDTGTIVFSSGFFAGLQKVDRLGGTPQPLTVLDAKRGEVGHAWPIALPGGNHVLMVTRTTPRERNRIEAVSLADGARTVVLEADALVGFADPWLLFVRAGALTAQAFDPKTLRLAGNPRVIVESARFEQTWLASGASAAADTLAYTPHRPDPVVLRWIDSAGVDLGPAAEEIDVRSVRLSPSGTQLMVEKLDRTQGAGDIWLLDLARGGRNRLSTYAGDEDVGVFLPAGAGMLYNHDFDGPYSIVRQDPDPLARPRSFLLEPGYDWAADDVSRDGRWVLAERSTADSDALWLVDLADPTRRTELVGPAVAPDNARFSPDGEWMAFSGVNGDRDEVFVRRVGGGPAVQVSSAGGGEPRWAPNGRLVYFVDGSSAIVAVALETSGRGVQPGPPRLVARYPGLIDYDVAPDGRLLVALAGTTDQILRVLTGWR